VIRLTRGAKPQVLVDKEGHWREEYLKRIGGDESVPKAALTRYAHEDVKAAVLRDSRGKCIYCESKPRAVYPGAVEHLLPKAADKFPERVVDWENLGFVCFECNREKLDYWDPIAPILDPYVDEPADHLVFFGPIVLARADSDRGAVTVNELALDRRLDLLDRKADRIRVVQGYLMSWQRADGAFKRVLAEKIRAFASREEEYTATIWALLDQYGFPR
jgi:hypothetical protein